jgi:hypothetical protein
MDNMCLHFKMQLHRLWVQVNNNFVKAIIKKSYKIKQKKSYKIKQINIQYLNFHQQIVNVNNQHIQISHCNPPQMIKNRCII